MLSANDAPELLVGMHQVARPRAWQQLTGITSTTPIRSPTCRRFVVCAAILTDYEPMLEWADAAIAAYVEGGDGRKPAGGLALALATTAGVASAA